VRSRDRFCKSEETSFAWKKNRKWRSHTFSSASSCMYLLATTLRRDFPRAIHLPYVSRNVQSTEPKCIIHISFPIFSLLLRAFFLRKFRWLSNKMALTR